MFYNFKWCGGTTSTSIYSTGTNVPYISLYVILNYYK
jgi:hypothetical protein